MKTKKGFEITPEEVADLMACALEGGINYWCMKAKVTQQPIEDWEFASDIIGLTNGILTITDDLGEKQELNKEKFLKGVEKTMEHYNYGTVEELMDNHDAEVADVIIQFALFDKIIYG